MLAKDWLLRLWSLWSIYKDSGESDNDRKFALLGILRLLGGVEVDNVNWFAEGTKDTLHDAKLYVSHLFEGVIEKRLNKWYGDVHFTELSKPRWELVYPVKLVSQSTEKVEFLEDVVQTLSKFTLSQSQDVVLFNRASLQRGFGSKSLGPHERLMLGDVIQFLLPQGFGSGVFLSSLHDQGGTPYFFVIGALLQTAGGQPWACIKQCFKHTSVLNTQIPCFKEEPLVRVSTANFYQSDISVPYHFVQLTGKVKKVGVIHDCSSGNCSYPSSTTVRHSVHTLEAGFFFILPRSMGYPPRRS